MLVQEKVDPVSLVAEELANLASNLRERVTADIKKVVLYFSENQIAGKLSSIW